MVTATTHLRMGPKQLHLYATAGTSRKTIKGRTLFLNINSNLLIQISEMNRSVLVMLMLKMTQHAIKTCLGLSPKIKEFSLFIAIMQLCLDLELEL